MEVVVSAVNGVGDISSDDLPGQEDSLISSHDATNGGMDSSCGDSDSLFAHERNLCSVSESNLSSDINPRIVTKRDSLKAPDSSSGLSSSDSLTTSSVFSTNSEEVAEMSSANATQSGSPKVGKAKIVKPICSRQHVMVSVSDVRRRLHSSPDCGSSGSSPRRQKDVNRSRASSLTNSPSLARRSPRHLSPRDKGSSEKLGGRENNTCTIYMQQTNPPSLSPRENKVSKRRKEIAHSFHSKPFGSLQSTEVTHNHHTHQHSSPKHAHCHSLQRSCHQESHQREQTAHKSQQKGAESPSQLRKKDHTIRELRKELKEMQKLLDEKNRSLMANELYPNDSSDFCKTKPRNSPTTRRKTTNGTGALSERRKSQPKDTTLLSSSPVTKRKASSPVQRSCSKDQKLCKQNFEVYPRNVKVQYENVINVTDHVEEATSHEKKCANDDKTQAGPLIDNTMSLENGIVENGSVQLGEVEDIGQDIGPDKSLTNGFPAEGHGRQDWDVLDGSQENIPTKTLQTKANEILTEPPGVATGSEGHGITKSETYSIIPVGVENGDVTAKDAGSTESGLNINLAERQDNDSDVFLEDADACEKSGGLNQHEHTNGEQEIVHTHVRLNGSHFEASTCGVEAESISQEPIAVSVMDVSDNADSCSKLICNEDKQLSQVSVCLPASSEPDRESYQETLNMENISHEESEEDCGINCEQDAGDKPASSSHRVEYCEKPDLVGTDLHEQNDANAVTDQGDYREVFCGGQRQGALGQEEEPKNPFSETSIVRSDHDHEPVQESLRLENGHVRENQDKCRPTLDPCGKTVEGVSIEEKIDSMGHLTGSLKDLQIKYAQVVEECQRTMILAEQYKKESTEMKEEMEVREEDHRQMYLQMYLKGQQMAMFERQQEIEELAAENPNNVMVQELLDKLNSIQAQLVHWQTIRRDEFYKHGDRPQTHHEATLRFLKDAFFHYLTDPKEAEQHMRAMIGIVGFTEEELKKITSAKHKDKGGKRKK